MTNLKIKYILTLFDFKINFTHEWSQSEDI